MKRNYISILVALAGSVILVALLGAIGLAGCYVYLEPSLPSVDAMRNVEMQVPLRVYTRDGDLIAQIGEQRRIPVTWEQIPELVKHAFLAAEDDRFFQHHGIDYQGVLRAVLVDIISGDRAQGASTITQQAARQLYLTLDKTWRRKLAEAFLTYRMEHEFSKQEIFALYLNVVFFGERAYGVAAAAETFYGKPLDQLSVAQAATLAGIVQLPSRYNPIVNPQFAKARRTYVLRRMKDLGYIDAATAAAANAESVEARTHAPLYDVDAQYVAEMARQEVRRRFGPKAETSGFRVYTTLDSRLQTAANRAVRLGLIEYDRRYGWRGASAHVDVPARADTGDLEDLLDEYPPIGPLLPSVVTEVADQSAKVYAKDLGFQQINWEGLAWARKQLDNERTGPAPRSAGEVLTRGDVVYIYTDGQHAAQLVQLPEAQAALVSLDPTDGAVSALVGGFDYFSNKFNRAVQAKRQPGSSFKPFLYSGALENGFTAASVLPDAPIVIEGSGMETAWRPKNSHGTFNGPTRLREALARSLNLVSIRLLREVGVDYAINYVTRFGFDKASLPNNFTLALGTMEIAPIDLAGAYATFANGGFRVSPYYIDRIEDLSGKVLFAANPPIACLQCEQSADLTTVPLRDAADATVAAADALRGGAGPLTPQLAGAAGDQSAERLHHDRHDGRRDPPAPWHRAPRRGPRPQRPGRQDRYHRQGQRCLVQRFQHQAGHHGVGGLRPGPPVGRIRGGLAHGAAHLDPLHARGAQECAAGKTAHARWAGAAAGVIGHRHPGECGKSRRHAGDLHGQSSSRQRHPGQWPAADQRADPDGQRVVVLKFFRV